MTLVLLRVGPPMAGFDPRFTISRKLLANLTQIAAAREIILHAYLVPNSERKP
jgi:hypothetical protein